MFRRLIIAVFPKHGRFFVLTDRNIRVYTAIIHIPEKLWNFVFYSAGFFDIYDISARENAMRL